MCAWAGITVGADATRDLALAGDEVDEWEDRLDARTPPAATGCWVSRAPLHPLSCERASLPCRYVPFLSTRSRSYLILFPRPRTVFFPHDTLLPSPSRYTDYYFIFLSALPLFSGHDTAMPLSEKENHVKGGLEEYEREESSRYPFLLSYRECKLLGIAGVRPTSFPFRPVFHLSTHRSASSSMPMTSSSST